MGVFTQAKLGLALGGGAAKGAAHIGVLKALKQHDINLHAISGTSVGAIIAAFYAFGKTPEQIYAIATQMTLGKISGFTLKKKGFSTTERLQELLIEHLGDVNIEQALLPLAIVATNICTGEKKVFTQGNLAKAVAASAAIPGLFIPVDIDGEEFVDGGLLENVPISVLKPFGVSASIAVNLNSGKRYLAPQAVFDVVSNALDIAINSKTQMQMRKADVAITMDLREFSRTDNRERTDELVEIGYQATIEQLSKIHYCSQSLAYRYSHQVTQYIGYLAQNIMRRRR